MITGYNHNARYKGILFHVQTEDGGERNPYITTHVFFQGNVITSFKSDYQALLNSPGMAETVRKMMQEQHKAMLRSLLHGEFDGLDQMKNLLQSQPAEADQKEEEAPRKSSVYQIYKPDGGEEKFDIDEEEKSLDEMVLEYLSERKD